MLLFTFKLANIFFPRGFHENALIFFLTEICALGKHGGLRIIGMNLSL